MITTKRKKELEEDIEILVDNLAMQYHHDNRTLLNTLYNILSLVAGYTIVSLWLVGAHNGGC